MSAARRPTASVMSLQIVSLVVMSALAAMVVWRAADTRRTNVWLPRHAIEEVRAASTTVMVAPYAYLHTRDARHLTDLTTAVAEARANVETLRSVVRGSGPAVDSAVFALNQLEANAGQIYNATDTADLSGTLEEMELARASLEMSIAKLEKSVEQRAQQHYEETTDLLLTLWGAMLLITVGTTVIARRRMRFNEDRDRVAARHLVQNVGTALRRAANGADEGRTDDIVAAPEFAELAEAATAVVAEVQRLRSANTQMTKSSSFLQDLLDALEMAETEYEAFRLGARAARVAYPDAGFQLLTVDEESGSMRPLDDEAGPACDVTEVEQCPVVRKGRTAHHLVEEGIGRCPRLRTDDACVTCALVRVTGQATAVAQVADYDPKQTQFEDLEALGLALGARLGVVRSLQKQSLEAGQDALTGLANRRILSDRLSRLDRTDAPYTVVVADLDHFKALNEQHGHEAGDRCLQIFADVMREASRDTDLPARLGGEEFVIVLPHEGMRAGLSVAMRMRAYLADAIRKAPAPFTVSIGVACRPDHGANAEVVMRAADDAVYASKEAGRDQVSPARTGAALDPLV